MLKVLVWKEWREHRLIFFMCLAIIVVTRIFLTLVLRIPKVAELPPDVIITSTNWLLSLAFTLFLGAAPFTNEFSKGTHTFLLCQPITRARFYWTKFFSGLSLLMVLVILINLALPQAFDSIFYVTSDIFIYAWSLIFITIVIYCSAFFTSLFLKDALVTIVATPGVILMGVLVILMPFILIIFPRVLFRPKQILNEYTFIIIGFVISFFFLSIGFLCWQKIISRVKSPVKILSLILICSISLFLLTYVILNIDAEIKFRKTIMTAKKIGLPLTIKEIIPPPVADIENSVSVYEEIFLIYERLKRRYREEWKYMPFESSIWNFDELSLIQKERLKEIFLNDSDSIKIYELLKKAYLIPYYRDDYKYEDGMIALLPYAHGRMHQIAKMVAIKIFLLTEQGEYNEALELASIGFHIGGALQNEPILSAQFLRQTCNYYTTLGLKETVTNIPASISLVDTYRKLITEIDLNNSKESLRIGFEGEIAIVIDTLFKNILKGKFQFDERFPDYYYGSFKGRSNIFLGIYKSPLGKSFVKKDAVSFLRYMTEIAPLYLSPYFQVKDKLNEIENRLLYKKAGSSPWNSFISLFLIRSVEAFLGRVVQNTVELGGLKIALTLKIYKAEKGEYPDSLDTLVPDYIPGLPKDPYIGKDYIYHKEGDGFIVYSVGRNEKDDGGVNAYSYKHSTIMEDDLAWRSSK